MPRLIASPGFTTFFHSAGYTLSFWMMIDNSDLMVNDGTLIDNGGYNSHGVAVYWQNGKLITKFVRPNGFTWIVSDNILQYRLDRLDKNVWLI